MSTPRLRDRIFSRMGLAPEDQAKALPMATAYGLVLASLYLLKPVRNALFLEVLGVEKLPYGLLLLAVSGGLTAWVYARVSAEASTRRLLAQTFVGLMVMQLGFRFLLETDAIWVYYALFVGVGMYSLLSTTLVWLLANAVFDAREARRTFGFIGAGGIAGAVLGGLFTRAAAPVLGTENLIFVSTGLLGAALVLLLRVPAKMNRRKRRRAGQVTAPFSEMLKTPLLVHLALLAAGVAVVAVIVDVQFNEVVQRNYPDKDDKAAFFGTFFASLSALGFVFQLFITPRILRRFGAAFGISLLPVLMGLGSAALLFVPNLITVGITKGADNGLRHSIHKAATEVLFLPISPALKRRAKLFLDTTVDTAASGMGALIVLVLVENFGVAHEKLSIVTVALVAMVLLVGFRLRRSHVDAFRSALERRSIDFSAVTDPLAEAGLLDVLIESLDSDNERNVLYALEAVRGMDSDRLQSKLTDLLSHEHRDVRLAALQRLQAISAQVAPDRIGTLLQDPDPRLRVAALNLSLESDADVATRLANELDSDDPQRQQAALGCLKVREDADLAALLTVDRVNRLRKSGREDTETVLAVLLGQTKEPELVAVYETLRKNGSVATQNGALEGIAKYGRADLLDWVVDRLHHRRHRAQAREVLVALGESARPALVQLLENNQSDRLLRLLAPKILVRSVGQNCWQDLLRNARTEDPGLRRSILRSLYRLRTENEVTGDLELMRELVDIELKAHRERAEAINGLPSDTPRRTLLVAALKEQQTRGHESLFYALALHIDPQDMNSAWNGLRSDAKQLRASALELLDYLLDDIVPPETEQLILQSLENKLETDTVSVEDIMERLIRSPHPWIRACALHALSPEEARRFSDSIATACSAQDPFVKESAQSAVAKAA